MKRIDRIKRILEWSLRFLSRWCKRRNSDGKSGKCVGCEMRTVCHRINHIIPLNWE